MKPTIIAGDLFFRSEGRTLTVREAIETLQYRIAKARVDRDHAATLAADVESRHRAAVVAGQRPDRSELTAAQAAFSAADAKVQAAIDELDQVRLAEVEHRSHRIVQAATSSLNEIETRFTQHAA